MDLSGKGFGYEHPAAWAQGTGPFGNGPSTADGLGTTEKWVVIRNAASVRSNGNLRVEAAMDGASSNYNMNQLLPETGVLVAVCVSNCAE